MKVVKRDNKDWPWLVTKQGNKTLPRSFDGINFDHEYFSLASRVLTIKVGYAIDGFTAFPDIKSEIHAAVYHDAILQAMDSGYITTSLTRDAHRVFRDSFKNKSLGKLLYLGIRAFYPIRQWRKRVFK